MVFVPASEKGDDQDYISLIRIIENLTGYKIEPIKVTDYNAAVEAMRAGRAMIAWYGGKTYIVAAEIADAEAFAAGVRKKNTRHLSKLVICCLLYTSDAADDSLRVDLGGRRIIKK